jgi:hypothetical protein
MQILCAIYIVVDVAELNNVSNSVYTCPTVCTEQLINAWRQTGPS